MKRAKIVSVKCESHTDTGFVDGWTVYFDNGRIESYDGEIPPIAVSRFCHRAKYGRKIIDGTSMTDYWDTMIVK